MDHFTEEEIEDWAMDPEKIKVDFLTYINEMLEFLGIKGDERVDSLTIVAGFDKDGKKENFGQITINRSEIVTIVVPNGSGKSRRYRLLKNNGNLRYRKQSANIICLTHE